MHPFKPALARGEIQCIGATTLDEYRQYIEKTALERRFQKIIEPTSEGNNIQQLTSRPYEVTIIMLFTQQLTNTVSDILKPLHNAMTLDEAGFCAHITHIEVPKSSRFRTSKTQLKML
jgi:ATP-dependent Clp protease ATP-binding subunit ClpC